MQQALTDASVLTGLPRDYLAAVLQIESFGGTQNRGYGIDGRLVSIGPGMLTPPVYHDILTEHAQELIPFLSQLQFGATYKSVIERMKGQLAHSRREVGAFIEDDELNILVMALRLKDLGAGRHPGSAYLAYVSPLMHDLLLAEPKGSTRTALAILQAYNDTQPDSRQRVSLRVVGNNPRIFGVVIYRKGDSVPEDHSLTADEVLRRINNEFRPFIIKTALKPERMPSRPAKPNAGAKPSNDPALK
ncbi:MAG: hypothetical protein P4M15_05685 [Alphaproteobacteria bacterium]|nr:hypothetical protein [Alphaproteobacteria bacterium]